MEKKKTGGQTVLAEDVGKIGGRKVSYFYVIIID